MRPGPPDELRGNGHPGEMARVRAWRRSLERSPDPVQRTLISRRGRHWPWYRRMVRSLAPAIATAIERRQEAAACLLRAQVAEGYLGWEQT